MIFRQLFDTPSSTLTYLIADDRGAAVIIDPVLEQAEQYLELLNELKLTLVWALDTHIHADHITGADALKQHTGATTVIAANCGASGYDRQLVDGEILVFGDESLRVIATPGHTSGSLCYIWRDRLFTGDTLMINACGRTDFQRGSSTEMYRSITQKLFILPDETLVYPGHDYKGRRVSSIGEEKVLNLRIAGKSEQEFCDIMDNLNLATPKRMHEAVPANLLGGRVE
ncbi:Beta-lactamase hydrolase-like protein [Ferriphaselus amnicola]|uniref:Beta-lactamase hydrolase-like protein n=1 Tax=Ferriphaselus amnicola TaxID=1188319 RepID=A0A2Z6GAE1_9PROT|nr:Beta-lactamase hydrolase-like protein [Ferriphaselus amnicola]